MPGHQLLSPIPRDLLGPLGGDERVVVFGVPTQRHARPGLQVHGQSLLVLLDYLPERVERLVLVEGPSLDAAMVRTVEDMLAAMGPEDGLVRFQIPAEAIKLVREDGSSLRFIEHGIDRNSLLAFRPPEVLRIPSLLAALVRGPVPEWVDPAGLVVGHGGLVDIHRPAVRRA